MDWKFYAFLYPDLEMNGVLLLNDHRESYSYCFSKCIQTGLPCLYSDIEGAIGERVREFNIQGMFPLEDRLSLTNFVAHVQEKGKQCLDVVPPPPPNLCSFTLSDTYLG